MNPAVRGTYSLAGKDKQAQQDTDGANDRRREGDNADQEKGREGGLDQRVAGFNADAEGGEEGVHGGQLMNNRKIVTLLMRTKVSVAVPPAP